MSSHVPKNLVPLGLKTQEKVSRIPPSPLTQLLPNLLPFCSSGPNSSYKYESSECFLLEKVPELKNYFTLEGKIGEGTFSKVFKARLIKNKDKEYALKYIIPTIKPDRIAVELRYLRDFGGSDNVCGVEAALLHNGHAVMVLPYFPHDKFTDYLHVMSIENIRLYMKNLLLALGRIHSHGIIHRDVKPTNFLYNHSLKKYLLVDFGLAQDQKDFQLLKKTFAQCVKQRQSLKECTNQQQPVRPILPATIQVVGKPENKQIVVGKRTKNEEGLMSKKMKNTQGFPIPVESSVFHTPETPTNAETPEKGFKNPGKVVAKTPTKMRNPALQASENVKTPIKSTQAASVTIIPETPLKTTTKETRQKMTAKRLITYDESPKSRLQDTTGITCECFQKPQVCKICTKKLEMYAPRAGTPGFRAPEVLLKTIEQSTAIDVWSAGVIFISLLSGRYPFFRNADDMTSLSEIISLLGTKRVFRAAKKLGKSLTIDPEVHPPKDLRRVCESLRGSEHALTDVPDAAYDLLDRLLDPHPLSRITAEHALKHSFFHPSPPPPPLSSLSLND